MKEEWKDIKGYEGLYKISNFGRIKSLYAWNGHKYIYKERIVSGWVQKPNKKYPYLRQCISLSKNGIKRIFKVHRLVAEAFVKNPNNYNVVNHIDFNPLNNRSDNLEWVTFKENIIYSQDHDRFLKIPKSEYKKIIDLYLEGYSSIKIAEKYNVEHTTILRILKQNGVDTSRTYTKYGIDLNELISDIKNGIGNIELSKKYNCSKDIIATRKYKFRKEGLL